RRGVIHVSLVAVDARASSSPETDLSTGPRHKSPFHPSRCVQTNDNSSVRRQRASQISFGQLSVTRYGRECKSKPRGCGRANSFSIGRPEKGEGALVSERRRRGVGADPAVGRVQGPDAPHLVVVQTEVERADILPQTV